MKKYLLVSFITLAYFSANAQTTFVYSGTGTNNFLAGGPSKISAVGDNTTIFLSPSFYHIGLAGVANNGLLGNIGVFGTTKQRTIGSASSHFGIYGDLSSNNINENNISVTGGFFTAKNIGTGTIITGVSATSTGSNNSSTNHGVNATATNSSNTSLNKTIGVRGESISGGSTTNNFLSTITNPGGYFTGNDGQGLYATTTGGYNFSTFGKVSQAITGYSSQTGAYINTGVVGYAAGTGSYKYGVIGYLSGTAGTATSAAIYGSDAINTADTYAAYFSGKVRIFDNLYVTTISPNNGASLSITGGLAVTGSFSATGTKNFMIDHPLDPENKILRHAAIESNEVLNQYSGNITTDAAGLAMVTLPNYFETLNKNFRYQLTAIGSFSQVIIKKKISNNQFIIQSKQPKIEVSWQITGVRNDRNMQFKPFVAESEKEDGDKGKYLSPEAYGKAQ